MHVDLKRLRADYSLKEAVMILSSAGFIVKQKARRKLRRRKLRYMIITVLFTRRSRKRGRKREVLPNDKQ